MSIHTDIDLVRFLPGGKSIFIKFFFSLFMQKKKPLQFKSHSLANQPLKALKIFEKTQRFEHLSNLKEFPSALKNPIVETKVV